MPSRPWWSHIPTSHDWLLKQIKSLFSLVSFINRFSFGGKNFSSRLTGTAWCSIFASFVYIQTDTSFHGFGAVLPDDWFAGSWAPWRERHRYSQSLPSHWCDDGHAIDPSLRCNINYLELFPVLIAACHWGSSWTNKCICVETDNTQAMVFINKGSCKNPIAMCWLRELFWLSVRHNFHLCEHHLAGINNVMRTDWVVQCYSQGSTDYDTTAADHCSKPKQHF